MISALSPSSSHPEREGRVSSGPTPSDLETFRWHCERSSLLTLSLDCGTSIVQRSWAYGHMGIWAYGHSIRPWTSSFEMKGAHRTEVHMWEVHQKQMSRITSRSMPLWVLPWRRLHCLHASGGVEVSIFPLIGIVDISMPGDSSIIDSSCV